MNTHVSPQDMDRREAAGFASHAAPDFRRANRHSARVRLVKRVLPAALIIALVLMIAVPLVGSSP